MRSQRGVLIGTIIITACIVSPICIVPCRADIADMASLRVGGTLTNSSSISMLDACANIRLVRSESGVSAQVSCRFMVVSNETVNASLAFVYPEHWRAIYGSGGINIDFSIQVNDSLVNTTLLTWENLTSQGYFPDPLDFAGGWVEGANFVLFSFEMLNNTTYVVETKTWAYPLYSNHYGDFYYIVGSARTFSGNAHQQVELLVVEETPFESIGFSPEN